MTSPRPTALRAIRTLRGTILGICTIAGLAHAGNTEKPAKLLYMLTDKTVDHAEDLAKCDRLTIEQYTKHGVRVIAKTEADLKTWLTTDAAQPVAKALESFQFIAYARANNVDAVGGLTAWVVDAEESERMGGFIAAGTYFHAWGFAISGISLNAVYDSRNGDRIEAIPFGLSRDIGTPWAIPTQVEAEPCSSGGAASAVHGGPPRPFLGVTMDENRVTGVTGNSPAKAAGLQAGDEFVTVNDQPIADLAALVSVLGDCKINDTVQLVYRRNGKEHKTAITLANRSDVMAKNSPFGKPLPDLIGKDINGKDVRLSDFRGKVVLLDYWATWCGPCLEETPLLQLNWERANRDDFVWIGVSVDDDKKAWERFVKNNQLGGLQVLSPEWGATMDIYSYPTILLADRSGMVQCEVRGESIAKATKSLIEAK